MNSIMMWSCFCISAPLKEGGHDYREGNENTDQYRHQLAAVLLANLGEATHFLPSSILIKSSSGRSSTEGAITSGAFVTSALASFPGRCLRGS